MVLAELAAFKEQERERLGGIYVFEMADLAALCPVQKTI